MSSLDNLDPTLLLDKELNHYEEHCSKLFQKVKQIEREYEAAKRKYETASEKLKELRKTKREQESKRLIEETNRTLGSKWIERKFEWSDNLFKLLKEKFGFDEFRPKQLAAINATLSKKDVLLVMPTGGGKSLVYQLPTLIEDGFSIIVSPLISLIEDQLIALKKIGINACTVHANTPKKDTKGIYKQMLDKDSDLKLLYVTPEWLAKSKLFVSNLKKSYEADRLARVAIDEVHCCSTWGHDFRPDYGYLGILRSMLEKTPFLGLTATATSSVLMDVQTMLNLRNCIIITAPFNRPNLFYKVLPKECTKDEQLDFLENLINNNYAKKSGIIYTNTVNECISLAVDLKNKGFKVAPYHAQHEPQQKKEIHEKWLNGTIQIVVATVAFGMGIDKPDVRFVIHHTIPKSMEALYQESGRAGRDGKEADCIVLFNLNDYFKVLGMVSSVLDEKKALHTLEYCLDRQKRSLIAKHFEEVWDQNQCDKMCDYCRNNSILNTYNLATTCANIHSLIDNAASIGEKLTLNKLLDAWFQQGPKKMRISSISAPVFPRQQADYIIAFLLLKKYLSIDKGCNSYSTICYVDKGRKVESGEAIMMVTADRFIGIPKIHPEDNSTNQPPKKKAKTGKC